MRDMFALCLAAVLLGAPALSLAQDEENPLDAEPAPAETAPAETAPAETAPAETVPAETVPAETGTPEATVTGEVPTVVLGLGAGVYIPTSALGVNFLVGVDASYQLPFLGGRFGVGAGLAYSQPTTEGQIADDRVPGGAAEYDSTMRELVLDLLLSFRVFGWDSVWSPRVGIGPVVYFLAHEVNSLGVVQYESSTQGGFVATVDVDYFIWRGALVGELRIPFATVGQRTTGDSNVGAFSVIMGYRFRL